MQPVENLERSHLPVLSASRAGPEESGGALIDLRCEKVKSFLERSCYHNAEHFIPPFYLPQYLLSMSKYLCFYKFLQSESLFSCLNQQRPHQTVSLHLELIINLKYLTIFFQHYFFLSPINKG